MPPPVLVSILLKKARPSEWLIGLFPRVCVPGMCVPGMLVCVPGMCAGCAGCVPGMREMFWRICPLASKRRRRSIHFVLVAQLSFATQRCCGDLV